MATSSRPYHHGDLRSALVEAALELSRGSGQSSVSLREVTRQVGVSPAAAYRHFRDRTELMAAVAREIQEKMATRMRRRMRASADAPPEQRALQRLRGVGLGYIAFAVDEPGWFETAFFGSARESELRERADGPGPGGGAEDAPPPFVLLTSALDECVQAGVLSAQRRPGAEFVCWSAVHGCAELVLHGPLRGAPRKVVREIAERVVDDVITGVR